MPRTQKRRPLDAGLRCAAIGYVRAMGPVVCSVDDSDGARAALHVARLLADGLGRKLVLLHVEPPTAAPGVSAAPAGQQRLRDTELGDAKALLARLAEDAGLGSEVELRADVGSAAKRIVDICGEEDAALVVLGSRGRGELKSAVLGSVSHAVARDASCPVVIVPLSAGR